MAYAVNCREINQRRSLGIAAHALTDGWLVFVQQKYGAGIGVDRQHMTCAVVFLVFASLLVFLDDATVVIVNMAAAHHAQLAAQLAKQGFLLTIQVYHRALLANHHAFGLQLLKIARRGLVNNVGVGSALPAASARASSVFTTS